MLRWHPDIVQTGQMTRLSGMTQRGLLILSALVCLIVGCGEDQRPATIEGTVYVVPYGSVHRDEIERAAQALSLETGRPTQIMPRQPLPQINRAESGQYAANAILDDLLRLAPVDAFRAVGVASVDLHAPGYRYVIGYARHGERALIYSTARMPEAISEITRRRWIRRIMAHELGHTYGAEHCSAHCLMRATRTVEDVEYLPDGYCPAHASLIDHGRRQNPGDPAFLALMAREQVRVGRWAEATAAYKAALLAEPEQTRLYVELGVALMAQGKLGSAVRAFEVATQLEPEAPQAYYGLAVIFAAGHAPWRAPAYIEAAVRRDPNPRRAHRAAGVLYTDLLHDEAAAARHFERYVQQGGRDAEIIARFVYLVSPTVVMIEQPETIMAQWQPGRGVVVAAMSLAEEALSSEPDPAHDLHGHATGAPDEMSRFATLLSAALASAQSLGSL